MSRWVEQFKTHGFQGVWSNIISTLKDTRVDDETVVTSVFELARLKKVVAYVDEILKSIDVELVPIATWDSFLAQATPCLQQMNNYNANRNIAHITQANGHADNLLTYVRPYMVLPSIAMDAMTHAAQKYAESLDDYAISFRDKAIGLLAEISDRTTSSGEMLRNIEEIKGKAISLETSFFGDENSGGVERKVSELVNDLVEKQREISTLYDGLFVGSSANEATVKKLAAAEEAVLENKTTIEGLLDEISTEVKELSQFHTKMFGKEDGDGKRLGGLSGEIDAKVIALSDFEGEQKIRYGALNSEIESLLPGATSAGLATAYKDMKNSFDAPIEHSSRVFYWSIGLLVLASFLLAIDSIGGEHWISFVKFDSWEIVLKGLVYKIPFYAPVLWLAFYATKRRSEYQRLQQEYAHKEALAKSYNSYKKQIEQLDDEDVAMQKEFIMKAIDAIAYNASGTLDGRHGDKMPAHDLIDKLVESISKLHGKT